MPIRLPYFKELPRYEVLREAAQQNPNIDPSGTLAFLHLMKTGTELLAYDAQILRSLGTRQGRFIILMLLKHCGTDAPTAAELAHSTGVTRATMSGLLDGLEKQNFVRRAIDAKDRRAVRVVLTESGRAFTQRIMPHYGRWFNRLMEPLTEPERQQLIFLLEKVQNRLAVLAEEPAAAA